MAVIAGWEYNRCPRQLFGAAEDEMVEMHFERHIERMDLRTQRRLPAKLIQALNYLRTIRPLERHNGQ